MLGESKQDLYWSIEESMDLEALDSLKVATQVDNVVKENYGMLAFICRDIV